MKNLIRHIRQSLALKLSVGILLLSLPIFIVSLGVLFGQSRRIIKHEAMERAVSVLYATSQRLCRYLDIVETATNVTSQLVTEHFRPDSLLSYSRRVVEVNGDIDGCSISAVPDMFEEYGRHFSAYSIRHGDSITTTIEEPYDYFNDIWYKKPVALGEGCWVDFYDNSDTLTFTLDGVIASFSKPLYDGDGRLLGVISTDLALRHLSAVISAEKPYPNSYFVMVDDEGCFFIHPDTTKLFAETIFTGRNPRDNADIYTLGHEMTSGGEGSMRVNIGGQYCLVCYRPVPGTPWSMALISPDSDILQAYYRLAYLLVPLLVVGVLLILLFSRGAVAESIRPLNRLLLQSQRIAEGHHDEPIAHTKRQDAVGTLQNSFATMQQYLNFHEGSIRYMMEHNQHRNEELQRANLQAEEAARQKAIFIQNMTHQIRTPLNIIMGFAEIAAANLGQLPEEEKRSIAGMMSHNSKMLSRMVLMLFDSSDTGNTLALELSSHKQELVACNEVAREAIGYTNRHFPSMPISLHTTVADDYCICTNRLYLMRSLRELLYNAAKYSDGKHVAFIVTTTDDTARFVIEDTGPGIATDYQTQMFEPFTKVDDLSEGLGLGLPLAKRHIANLGGTVVLDADYRDGCRFIIDFPLA